MKPRAVVAARKEAPEASIFIGLQLPDCLSLAFDVTAVCVTSFKMGLLSKSCTCPVCVCVCVRARARVPACVHVSCVCTYTHG